MNSNDWPKKEENLQKWIEKFACTKMLFLLILIKKILCIAFSWNHLNMEIGRYQKYMGIDTHISLTNEISQ